MQYRTFGKLDWKPSALGFGAMRLPVIDNDAGKIDEEEATRMVRYAIDQGVNYVDTAYPYHRETCEAFLGRALQDGYRQRVRMATKLPCWLVKEADDFDRYLDEQLQKLQADYIDFYLLHGLGEDSWPKVRDLGVLTWAERALADGRIGHLGFSFHDRVEVFEEIVDATDLWTLCQIQYNLVDTMHQAGTRGLQYAASKGLAVVVMEPLRGGALARNIPPAVQALWDSYTPHPSPPSLRSGLNDGLPEGEGVMPLSLRERGGGEGRTPADWALQWVWNQPEVSLVLSGMTTMEQLVENIAIADRSKPGILTAEQLALIDRVREAYRAISPVPCTSCGYCMPCSSGVEIPRIFELYSDAIMYDDPVTTRFLYRGPTVLKPEQRADQCIECGECMKACPQNIAIPEQLQKAHALLGPRKQSA